MYLFPTWLGNGSLGPVIARIRLDGSSSCPGNMALLFCYWLCSIWRCQHHSLPFSCAPLHVLGSLFESLFNTAWFSSRQRLQNTDCLDLSKSPMLSNEEPHAVQQP